MIRDYLPGKLKRVLWGDRDKFGYLPIESDRDWRVWQEKAYTDFYQETQQKGLGQIVNSMIYPVMSRVNFDQLKILEIGPGIIRHLQYIGSEVDTYILCDIEPESLKHAERQLTESGINFQSIIKSRSEFSLPLEDRSVDAIVTFNSLEHLYPIDDHLREFNRVLKPGGRVIGGIPCEGGLAWGLGRYLTTRRYVHNAYSINYDKIICWEHPNFSDAIIEKLNEYFELEQMTRHPFPKLPIDLNLMLSFIYKKRNRDIR